PRLRTSRRAARHGSLAATAFVAGRAGFVPGPSCRGDDDVSAVRIESTEIPDLVIAHLRAFPDARGSFRELFRAEHFAAAGLPSAIAQVNHSRSARGVVRGLHFQWEPPMAKL